MHIIKSSTFAHYFLPNSAMEIFDRLKIARERSGFTTAKDAATSLGLPYYTYAQHENGNRNIPRDAILKYARRFKVSPDWLLTGREGKATPMIPLKRYIGAGGTVYPFDDDQSEFIEAPPGVEGDALAAMPLLLSGCIANQPATGATLKKLQLQCEQYGYQPGSPAYSDCVFQLDQNRIADFQNRMARTGAAISQAGRNMQTANRPLNCNSTGVGNTVYTNCY
jgi:transcriptional regulator with XRE-family HTH domain